MCIYEDRVCRTHVLVVLHPQPLRASVQPSLLIQQFYGMVQSEPSPSGLASRHTTGQAVCPRDCIHPHSMPDRKRCSLASCPLSRCCDTLSRYVLVGRD